MDLSLLETKFLRFHDMPSKLLIKNSGARERAHWVRSPARQAWRSTFGSHYPHKKSGMVMPLPVKPSTLGDRVGTGGYLGSLAASLAPTSVREPASKRIRWGVKVGHPTSLCICVFSPYTCIHTPHSHLWHNKHSQIHAVLRFLLL